MSVTRNVTDQAQSHGTKHRGRVILSIREALISPSVSWQMQKVENCKQTTTSGRDGRVPYANISWMVIMMDVGRFHQDPVKVTETFP